MSEFYLNGAKIWASLNQQRFTEIGITSSAIYLRTAVKELVYRIKYSSKKRLTWSMAKRCENFGSWSRLLHERIRHERIELYFDFKLSHEDQLHVTFDRFASSFDLM